MGKLKVYLTSRTDEHFRSYLVSNYESRNALSFVAEIAIKDFLHKEAPELELFGKWDMLDRV